MEYRFFSDPGHGWLEVPGHELAARGILKEISGLGYVSLQPSAGSEAIYTNVSIIRAYHESRGELNQRDEVITTIFSVSR